MMLPIRTTNLNNLVEQNVSSGWVTRYDSFLFLRKHHKNMSEEYIGHIKFTVETCADTVIKQRPSSSGLEYYSNQLFALYNNSFSQRFNKFVVHRMSRLGKKANEYQYRRLKGEMGEWLNRSGNT